MSFLIGHPSLRFAAFAVFAAFSWMMFFPLPTLSAAELLETKDLPALMASIDFDQTLSFCGEPVPIHLESVRERLEKEMLLNLWDRPQVILWLKRSGRYMPYIETMLRQANLPDDLKYIAVIESALRPHVASHAGAVGFWQFIRSTGSQYGLRIDGDVDERRSFHRSTQAAIAYLRFLYQDLGSWTLAAAAYNMGEEGLKSEILAQEVEDYYRLYLPRETQRYIFRALAAKLILSHPHVYGFDLDAKDRYAPLAVDQVTVHCRQETPILLIAKAANTDFKVIKDLNPQLRGHYLGKGEYPILVPRGEGKGFSDRFQKQLENHAADSRRRIYVVRKGDNLTAIAARFDVPLPALVLWNSLNPRKPIHPGDRLVIYLK